MVFGIEGLANSFWDHIKQMSFRQMNFEFTYVFITMKILNILWKHLLPIIKRLILKNSYVCPIWIFIFVTAQAQINSELCWVELTHKIIKRKNGK
jgi:hypothetical protein